LIPSVAATPLVELPPPPAGGVAGGQCAVRAALHRLLPGALRGLAGVESAVGRLAGLLADRQLCDRPLLRRPGDALGRGDQAGHPHPDHLDAKHRRVSGVALVHCQPGPGADLPRLYCADAACVCPQQRLAAAVRESAAGGTLPQQGAVAGARPGWVPAPVASGAGLEPAGGQAAAGGSQPCRLARSLPGMPNRPGGGIL